MKIVAINSYSYGSTGAIMRGVSEVAMQDGHIVFNAYPAARSMREHKRTYDIEIGNRLSRNIHIILGYITGLHGFFSVIDTIIFIRKLKKISPDIIHLHNLHGDYINLPLLFRYILNHKIKCIWTLHDCWALTGQCTHFAYEGCEKWKTQCVNCPKIYNYPKSLVDNSLLNHILKKRIFTSLKEIKIVTPSKWLAGIVKESYLSKYSVHVIYNGIQLPVKIKSGNVRNKYGIPENKKIILGVAFEWTYKKGIDVFCEMSEMIDDEYVIVLIGHVNENIRKQYDLTKIIMINRTNNKDELNSLYSEASVFANPTREEVLGLVNLESLSCGTPVVTFNTGGSPECISEKTGAVVSSGDLLSMFKECVRFSNIKDEISNECVIRATQFHSIIKYRDYLSLYNEC